MKKSQLRNLSHFYVGITIICVLLTGCTKDLFYIPGTIQEEIEKAIEGGFDGMIVYVNQAGKSDFYSAGFDNREKQIPANPHALFKIASISKLYIAAAVTKLVAAGDLVLDETLVELIPALEDRVENADRITLKNMISHRSGIPEYIYEPEFESGTNESYMETAALIFDKAADFRGNS